MVAFDFLRLLLTRWTRDCADFELERVENRQNTNVADEFSVITFFGTFRRPNGMARVNQNLKADRSCHNTNVFQIRTRVNVTSLA